MRRDYISPEFTKNYVFGTYNMAEQSTFFGAKMLEIEDKITVATENFVWFQRSNGEQTDLETEKTIDTYVFTSTDSKQKNHTLTLDPSQPAFKRENATVWILNVNVNTILSEYIFAELKRNRTFEGVTSKMTLDNNVDQAIRTYVSRNVLDRYKLTGIDLYLSYVELAKNKSLKFKNVWDQDVAVAPNLFNKVQYTMDSKNEKLTMIFEQQRPGSSHNFKYFFNLKFDKI